MDNSLLDLIKKDIFRGLKEYLKTFPDLDLWQFLRPFDYKKDTSSIYDEIKKGLIDHKEILLYVHLPFCFSGCAFCNVNPFKSNKIIQIPYFEFLLKEIKTFAESALFKNKKISCIYFGGGTPTCFGIKSLAKLVENINRFFNLKENCNITCETHPLHLLGQSGKKAIKDLQGAGINRMSMGVQTFDQRVLKYCNRYHTVADIEEALNNLKTANMHHNLDMMIGLPGQTLSGVEQDLKKLEELKPDAVEYMRHSVVNRRVINLYKKSPELLTDKNTLFEMQLMVHEWIEKNNYEQNGYFSKNSPFFPYRYAWVMEVPYLAFGARARSHLGGITFLNYSHLIDYFLSIERKIIPVESFRIPNETEKIFRTLYLRLQTQDGISRAELQQRYGSNHYLIIEPVIEKLKQYNLIINDNKVIKLTNPYGRYFLEDICNLIKKETLSLV